MTHLTTEKVIEYGPSQLPAIEGICRYMINTRRFSQETKSILQLIWVPDCVSRDIPIQFCVDSEKLIPEWFITTLQKELDDDWDKYDKHIPGKNKKGK